MKLIDVLYGGMNWTVLCQDRDQWREFVSSVYTLEFHNILRNSWVSDRLATSLDVLSLELYSCDCGKAENTLRLN
jgi:hypothetical protein